MYKKPLVFIIPTCDRLECIKYYLDTQLESFNKHNIDIVIYDSSMNDDVRHYVERLIKCGCKNLAYKKYDSYNQRAIDDKVFCACREFSCQYEYLWFSSDGTVFQIDNLWEEVFACIKNRYDLIVLNHKHSDNKEKQLYFETKKLLLNCGWILTMLGAGIVSADVVCKAVNDFPPESKENFWLWYPLAYFHAYAEQPFKSIWLDLDCAYCENPFRKDAFWKLNGDALWQWGEVWVSAIESLPDYYDDVKQEIIRSWDKHTRLFSPKGLMGMRAQGQIKMSDVTAYRKYIPQITDTSLFWFYLITLPGTKNLLKIIRNIYRLSKKFSSH